MAGIGSSLLSSQVEVQNIVVGTPTITNEAITLADTEYSYALPTGTHRVIMQSRLEGLVKIAYTVGESSTNYWTIFPGQQKDIEFLNGSTAVTLYFQSSKAAQVLEIESWI